MNGGENDSSSQGGYSLHSMKKSLLFKISGLFFGMVYLWRRSLVPTKVMHFLPDFIGIVLKPMLQLKRTTEVSPALGHGQRKSEKVCRQLPGEK
jgi:hypothetical protein